MTTPLTTSEDRLAKAVLRESWEYTDADTQRFTHNIHRYSGKFIPQIAERAISLLTLPGELVVDPYCGSGTTLLEAALLNRRAVGIDLNPLAVLIARVKTTPIEKATLNGLVIRLSEELSIHDDESSSSMSRGASEESACALNRDPRFHHEWYRKWFQPHVLKDLLAIDLAIHGMDVEALRDVGRVAFSNILRRCSNAHSSYPNVMFDKNAPIKASPVSAFLATLNRNAEMVASLSNVQASWSNIEVVLGNASTLQIDDNTVDAVISHPPYIGSIPYAEYGALSLQWLGTDSKRLDRELTGGRRQSKDVVERFENAYGQMLRETYRVLRPGRHAFLMVGNPVVRGKIVDLPHMTVRIACEVGLELAARTERNGVNRRANKMGAEHLLFFRKPR